MGRVREFTIKVNENPECYIPSPDGVMTVTGQLVIELAEGELLLLDVCILLYYNYTNLIIVYLIRVPVTPFLGGSYRTLHI